MPLRSMRMGTCSFTNGISSAEFSDLIGSRLNWSLKGALFWRPQTSVVAAKALGILDHGIASVRVEVVKTSVSTNRRNWPVRRRINQVIECKTAMSPRALRVPMRLHDQKREHLIEYQREDRIK